MISDLFAAALAIPFRQDLAWGELLLFLSDWVIRVVMLILVPQRRDPGSARAWLILILLLPWIGLLAYLVLGRVRVAAQRRQRHLAYSPPSPPPTRQTTAPGEVAAGLDPQLRPVAELVEALSGLGILAGNSVTLLDDYQGSIDQLIADIDQASQHVHLVYYIFADDATGRRVAAALARAAARGVACRLLVDALGSRPALRTLLPQLRQQGVPAHAISPPGWAHLLQRHRTSRIDLRNHRKIVVIDGNIGYTGSQNIVDADFKPGIVYEELVARVSGPVVDQLQAVFLRDWFIDTHELLVLEDTQQGNLGDCGLATLQQPSPAGDGFAQVLPSGPEYGSEANQRVFISLLYAARHRIVLTSPYFIPDLALRNALETAALRGVDTHLIVSQAADQFFVSQAQRSFYAELLEMGVHVHLYTPAFLHAKHLTIDDDLLVIGSSNLDRRSFSLNAEISLLFYGKEAAARLHAIEERNLADAHELTAAEWAGRPWFHKVIQNTTRLMDTLL